MVQNGAKMGKMAIFHTISARELIFVATTPFSYQLSSILELPDTSENWLLLILAPGGPKLVQNGAKMGKISIFQTISARKFIFVRTTPFSTQLTLILALSDTSENWLP